MPNANWTFNNWLQQNDMFILGIPDEELPQTLENNEYNLLSKYLYSIQNLAVNSKGKIIQPIIRICHHHETQYELNKANKPDKRFFNIQSLDAWDKLNPVKVIINCLGRITSINGKQL